MDFDRRGEVLWSEWDGSGLPTPKASVVRFYTIGHVDIANDVVLRALASAVQREGIAETLGRAFQQIQPFTAVHGLSGEIDGGVEIAVCDENGHTYYGDTVDEVLPDNLGRGRSLVIDREYNWKDDSQCSTEYNIPYRDYFFSEDESEISYAKEICLSCPVREECLRSALDNKEVWGVWGGRDEIEIRNTLSVNEDVQEVRRLRDGISPVCLYCNAATEHLSIQELDVPGGGRWTTKKVITCNKCDFYWTSRTSANAIEAYMATKYR